MHEALEVVQGLVLEGVEANLRANARAEAVVACGGASRWGALHRSFVGVGGGDMGGDWDVAPAAHAMRQGWP